MSHTAIECETLIPEPAGSTVVSSLITPFVKRAVGLIGIGLLNLLVICSLGTVLFVLPDNTNWDYWLREYVQLQISALLFAPILLLACVLVLAKQRLVYRVIGGFVTLSFAALVLSVPLGYRMGLEHPIVFLLCLVTLIPARVLLSWSIHWSYEQPRQTRTGQFTIADYLSWTAAIAITFACLRPLFMGSRSAWLQLPEALGTIGVSCIVAVPCVWLAFSRISRSRGTLWIALWVLGVSFFWVAALWVWYYNFPRTGFIWWHVLLIGARMGVYLPTLAMSLLGNILAMEWLGVRWTRTPITLTRRKAA